MGKMKIIAFVLCSTMLTLCADAAFNDTNRHRLRESIRRLEGKKRSLQFNLNIQRSGWRKAETEVSSLKAENAVLKRSEDTLHRKLSDSRDEIRAAKNSLRAAWGKAKAFDTQN